MVTVDVKMVPDCTYKELNMTKASELADLVKYKLPCLPEDDTGVC